MYKVTYIDKQDNSYVKAEVFNTMQEAISFTNKKEFGKFGNNNEILELKFYDEQPLKKENRA
jgi:hypothetical protein